MMVNQVPAETSQEDRQVLRPEVKTCSGISGSSLLAEALPELSAAVNGYNPVQPRRAEAGVLRPHTSLREISVDGIHYLAEAIRSSFGKLSDGDGISSWQDAELAWQLLNKAQLAPEVVGKVETLNRLGMPLRMGPELSIADIGTGAGGVVNAIVRRAIKGSGESRVNADDIPMIVSVDGSAEQLSGALINSAVYGYSHLTFLTTDFPSTEQLEDLRQRGYRIVFVYGLFEQTESLSSQSYDFALGDHSIVYADNAKIFRERVDELHRILKIGGRAAISCLNPDYGGAVSSTRMGKEVLLATLWQMIFSRPTRRSLVWGIRNAEALKRQLQVLIPFESFQSIDAVMRGSNFSDSLTHHHTVNSMIIFYVGEK